MAINSTNPCICTVSYTAPAPCPSDSNCLTLGHILAQGEADLDPCSGNGSVSFDCYDYTACGVTNPTFTVISNSHEGLLNVLTIDYTGLTFETTDESLAGAVVTILIRAICGEYGAYGTVTITVPDPCVGLVCPGQVCDPCTVTCVDEEIDIIVE